MSQPTVRVKRSELPPLDPSLKMHGILPRTGRCFTCGMKLKYVGNGRYRNYCSNDCRALRPPKMVLAELHHGKRFRDIALEHLNSGGTLTSLAAMCGVHNQAIYKWIEMWKIRRVTFWTCDREDDDDE